MLALIVQKAPFSGKTEVLTHIMTFSVGVTGRFLPELLCQFNTFIFYLEEKGNYILETPPLFHLFLNKKKNTSWLIRNFFGFKIHFIIAI